MDPTIIAIEGFDPYSETAFLGDVWKAAKKVGKTVVKGAKAVAPLAVRAMPMAQKALKNVPPWGTVASAALGAMAAGLKGKSLEEIGWAAAEGAAPSGIDTAIKAAKDLRHGRNVLSTALSAAGDQFLPGTAEKAGFNVAERVLKGGNVSKAALGAARGQLRSEAQRRAFDVAVGTVARQAKRQAKAIKPKSAKQRAGEAAGRAATSAMRAATASPRAVRRPTKRPAVNLHRGKTPIKTMSRSARQVAAALNRNPALAAQPTTQIARALGVRPTAVARAVKRAPDRLPFRSLPGFAASWVSRFAPYIGSAALRDTGGLEEGGTVYVVESGDSPWKIAETITGSGLRWRELMKANPQIKTNSDGAPISFWAGMRLKLPASWAEFTRTDAVDAPTTPLATAETTAAVLQGKALLAAWGKTDGLNQSGLPDYGTNILDATTEWTARDRMMAMSFANWRGIESDGRPTAGLLESLRKWAEERAQLPSSLPTTTPAVEVEPTPIQLPEIVIAEPPFISEPAPAPSAPVPSFTFPFPTATAPSAPAPTPIQVSVPEIFTPSPSVPVPVAISTPAPAPSSSTPDNDAAPLIAGGAALAYLLL